jgi:hypothetical protein
MLLWPKELLYQPVEERRTKKAKRRSEEGEARCSNSLAV